MGTKKREYTYCPDCHNDDKKGYRGKRCGWCCALLIKDPLNKFFKQNDTILAKGEPK